MTGASIPTAFSGSQLEDYSILGSKLGFPYSGKLPYEPFGEATCRGHEAPCLHLQLEPATQPSKVLALLTHLLMSKGLQPTGDNDPAS